MALEEDEKKGENGMDEVTSGQPKAFPNGAGPMDREDSRFGGLGASVEASIASSVERDLGNYLANFPITPTDLGQLSNERTRLALIEILQKGIPRKDHDLTVDEEAPSSRRKINADVHKLIDNMVLEEGAGPYEEHTPEYAEAQKNADLAANLMTSLLLRSSPESGIDPREVEHRQEVFGSNAIADKKLSSFIELCVEAVQDFVLIMLIILGAISIGVEVSTHDRGECTTCWIEGAAILCSVCIVVFVTAGIDYAKQFAFIRLTRSLHETNTKAVIRDGKQVAVVDDDIVVGDILSVNSHNLASIPADCVLLGPPADLKMDESTLTGESKAINKKPGDVVLSGTTAIEGSGKMVVIAVGVYSVAGRIKARVYESEDHEDDLGGDDDSPLFVKLDLIAKQIGIAGTVAAAIAFIASCIIGLLIEDDDPDKVLDYLIVAITVLAVAVPEGLPLAVTLALAFSSNKMMRDQNLVKHLDACETMGCATTICTDKTGTLTANKMTARALFAGLRNIVLDDPTIKLGDHVRNEGTSPRVLDLIGRAIAIDTMNETVLYYKDNTKELERASGNPTEVALLTFLHDMGMDYEVIRNTTRGRSSVGKLGEYLSEGKLFGFSSARKMMSWAVPKEEGGYRIFSKGAQEVLLARCTKYVDENGDVHPMTDEVASEMAKTSQLYARRGMRCLALAYGDLDKDISFNQTSETVKNADGTPALEAESELTALALVGIEDPLRPEVPVAIEKCYRAGIDVRMVTGDNPNTAVSIAYQAGILRDFHFRAGTSERVADNLRPNVLMTGSDFRAQVYRPTEGDNDEFDQVHFDRIWPHLRVLARSSPDDKLTLAHGLNQSTLFADHDLCKKLQKEDNITIFPDRQVVAMTGDGTNDAPALKRADIGFAMGVAGTQIAKDAADIILLDDNFASIVTAAKWGRNVYASIQKFLQFQLTVNIAAVITALTGAFAYQTSPLAAIQLLWVNLLMDALASLALASEPPVDSLLEKPPVNRTEHMITKRMWANMLGQASYQIAVVMTLLFNPSLLELEAGHVVEDRDENSEHYTLIFNAFVWMQLFNEVNCRKLKGELNVFAGMQNNTLFCSILFVTAVLQVIIVQFGSVAFHVYKDGLDAKFWGLSLALGAGSLPVQQIINVLYEAGLQYKGYRNQNRLKRERRMTTQPANGSNRVEREHHD